MEKVKKMTNFEREEGRILCEADSAKKHALRQITSGAWTKRQAHEYLNKRLYELQREWFNLHRKLVEVKEEDEN